MSLFTGAKDVLYVGLLRLLSEAAVPGFPLPDVRLQVSPALQHRGPAHVCQLRSAGVSVIVSASLNYFAYCVYRVQLKMSSLCIVHLYLLFMFSLLLASKFLVHHPISQEEASSEGTTPLSEMYPSLPPSE